MVLHKDTRPMMPMQPGQVARRDYEYKCCGTANVLCGIEPEAGVHFTKVTPTRSSPEFADFILELAAHYPAADTIHLIVDNLSTHTRKALTDRFGENDGGWLWNRFTVQLHAHSWKLAQSGRDRDRSFRPPMPGKTQDRRYWPTASSSQSLESPHKPQADHHSVEVHKKTGPPET